MQFLKNIPIRDILSVCDAKTLTGNNYVLSVVEKL